MKDRQMDVGIHNIPIAFFFKSVGMKMNLKDCFKMKRKKIKLESHQNLIST